ncbi:MAG: thiolase C-terminal domain-containing protein [Candidatus Ranarchaeia archaeon]
MSKVYITGISLSKIGTYFEKELTDLFLDPAHNAIKEVDNAKIEALFVGNMAVSETESQLNVGALLADSAGLGNIRAIRIESAGSSGGEAIAEGYSAIASGQFDTVMVAGVEKATDHTSNVQISTETMGAHRYLEGYQGATLASLNGILMRLYMNEYKLTRDDMSLWPVAMHDHATKSKHAALPRPTTVDRVGKSLLVADPIRQFDCAMIGDGAAVVILQSEDSVKNKDQAIEIAGIGHGSDALALQQRDDLLVSKATEIAAKQAYEKAGIKPDDISVADIHDDYTVMGFYGLEGLGFAKKGEAVNLLRNGDINVGGKIPANLTGGCKARGYPLGATGVYQIAELTMQLRGTAGEAQVPDASYALAHSSGSLGANSVVTILKK